MSSHADSSLVGRAQLAYRWLIARALRWRIVRAALRYSEHRGSMLADSITYRALFGVFAGVLLLFSVAALWLGGDPEAMSALSAALDEFVPGLTSVVDLDKLNAPVGFSVLGAVSVLGIVGAAVSAVESLRTSLRVLADGVFDDIFVVWAKLRNLLVAVVFGVLVVAAAALSMLNSELLRLLNEWIGGEADAALHWGARGASLIVTLIIDMLAVAVAFRVLSGVRAPAKALWSGALIGGIGLVVLQELSALFVRGATSNPLLASFASLIALLLWMNLSAQVVLIASSCVITATAEAQDRVRERYGASTLAQRTRLRAEDRLRAASRELNDAIAKERAEREPSEKH